MQKTKRGFTLIEVMVSMAVLSIIVLAIYALLHTASSSYNSTSRTNILQTNGRNALDRLAEELRFANPADSAWTLQSQVHSETKTSYTYLKFQKAIGYDDVNKLTLWSTDTEYFWEPSATDANNNGVQDEGRLVRTSVDAKGVTVKAGICDYVQAGGFTVEQDGNVLTLTLKLMVADEKQKMRTATVTTTVVRRNKAI